MKVKILPRYTKLKHLLNRCLLKGTLCIATRIIKKLQVFFAIFFLLSKNSILYCNQEAFTDYIEMKKKPTTPVSFRFKQLKDSEVKILFDIDLTLDTGNLMLREKEYYEEKYANFSKKESFVDFFEEVKKYTTYADFFSNHGWTTEEYEKIADAFKVEKHVKKNDKIVEMIKKLKERNFRVFCFTNSECKRAEKILKALGIDGLIEGVMGTTRDVSNLIAKPMNEAYIYIERILGIELKKNVYLFDDNIINIIVAKNHGWNAIHVLPEHDLKDLVFKTLGITEKKKGKIHNFYRSRQLSV